MSDPYDRVLLEIERRCKMARRKMIYSKCETCGVTTFDKHRAIRECYSCGVKRWERFDGIQRSPDHLTVVGK